MHAASWTTTGPVCCAEHWTSVCFFFKLLLNGSFCMIVRLVAFGFFEWGLKTFQFSFLHCSVLLRMSRHRDPRLCCTSVRLSDLEALVSNFWILYYPACFSFQLSDFGPFFSCHKKKVPSSSEGLKAIISLFSPQLYTYYIFQ